MEVITKGEKWTDYDYEQLDMLASDGNTLSDMIEITGRTEHGIRSKLRQLGYYKNGAAFLDGKHITGGLKISIIMQETNRTLKNQGKKQIEYNKAWLV